MTSGIEGVRISTRDRVALALVGVAVVSGAIWTRTWGQPYLVVASLAITFVLLLTWRAQPRSWWLTILLVQLTFVASAWRAQSALSATTVSPSPERAAHASSAAREAIAKSIEDVRTAAQRMLAVSPDSPNRFLELESRLPTPSDGEASAIVLQAGIPYGWIGVVRLPLDSLRDTVGVARNEFYTILYATAQRGPRRAVVMRTLHAEAPADRLSSALLGIVARRVGAEHFDLRVQGGEVSDEPLVVASDTVAQLRPVFATPVVDRLRLEEGTRVVATSLLGLTILLGVGMAWRRPAGLGQRLAALSVALGAVAFAPLNALSNTAAVFNPSYYFSPRAGPFSSSVATLALSGMVASLAVFAIIRSRQRPPPAWLSVPLAVLCVSLGPFVLRDLARGLTLPPRGVPATLWMSWEVALFLPAVAILLLGAWAARSMRSVLRLPPALASTVAALAAMIAPMVWQAPGRFPSWYVVAWMVATGLLIFARRTRPFAIHVALVAACAATTLVWSSVTRKRVELAQRDVAGLATADPETVRLLERLLDRLSERAEPRTLADLLKLYVGSELAYGGNPVELAVWTSGATRPDAELVVADLRRRAEGERALVQEALATSSSLIREFGSSQGAQLVLATPLDSTHVLSVVAAPRSRVIEEDPYAALFGLDVPTVVEPAYHLVVSAEDPREIVRGPQWVRRGYELHGDWTIEAAQGNLHAHVEVELRSLDALLTRGALLVLLDVVVFGALWLLVTTADGALRRWLRARTSRWRGSYRSRLTFTLFAAFVAPSVALAIWTYERLKGEDLLSRSLLVQETLRSVRLRDTQSLEAESERIDLPLLWYRRGVLDDASNPLYMALAPLGLYVDPVAAEDVVFGQEVAANRRVTVGPVPTLVGYRQVADGRLLATPARRSELPLERQQRDLLALLALALVLGALIALWISGVAARAFARPIGALRQAAEDVAGGARELPSLGVTPASEFTTVYATFRQMAVDLSDSRRAVESAQRRTAAVLRDVGSGVIAFDREARILLANPQAEHILGMALGPGDRLAGGAERVGAEVTAFLAEDAELASFDLELRGRQVRARLTRLMRGDGGAVLTIDDVSDVARAQRVLAWGEMARQVAHEIKNPLTPIRLGVQHVRRAHADAHPDFRQILERNVARILEEIDRLDEIARAFAKFGTRPDDAETRAVVNVADVARDVADLERMGDSGVTWDVVAPESVRAHTRDAELREVLLNLLENARHAHAKHVTVRVTPAGGEVVLAIEDDGDGIADAVLARAFEPHFSTHTSGSGLGLAISRRLVESWGGTIRLERAEPRGTRVVLTLVAEGAS